LILSSEFARRAMSTQPNAILQLLQAMQKSKPSRELSASPRFN
jgi:hypothetical protein